MTEAYEKAGARLLTRLRSAKWYAFDLDDTLHSFRHASSAATTCVLTSLQSKTPHTLEDLEKEYKRILIQGTASAFTDGKTSHQYREERFQHLVRHFEIELAEDEMQRLVDLYEQVLMQNLQLKPGVLELFGTLKRHGHRIAVVTEGPQDAQERTVEALGIADYVDYLATTNKLGVAKVDGLFGRVLEYLGVGPGEVVVVGDSWERDVVPAMQEGVYCFHYNEKGGGVVETDGVKSIETLEDLRVLVETAHRESEA